MTYNMVAAVVVIAVAVHVLPVLVAAVVVIAVAVHVLPVLVAALVFVISCFTGWNVSFGLRKIPIPVLDIIKIHVEYDKTRPLAGTFIGFYIFFLQVVWEDV